MALYRLICADVPLRIYSLTRLLARSRTTNTLLQAPCVSVQKNVCSLCSADVDFARCLHCKLQTIRREIAACCQGIVTA